MGNVEQLKMFIEAAQTGSFSGAARKLGKAQSAVSQGIANLEIDLGIKLFDRQTRKPTLTEQGQNLLNHAKAVVTQYAEFNNVANALHNEEEVAITIAIDSALLLPPMMAILNEFSALFKATAIELKTVDSADICDEVANGRVDLGCMLSDLSFPPSVVDFCFIGHLPFTPVCSTNHPLTGYQVSKFEYADATSSNFTAGRFRRSTNSTTSYVSTCVVEQQLRQYFSLG